MEDTEVSQWVRNEVFVGRIFKLQYNVQRTDEESHPSSRTTGAT